MSSFGYTGWKDVGGNILLGKGVEVVSGGRERVWRNFTDMC